MKIFITFVFLVINLFSQEIKNQIELTPQEQEFIDNTNLKVSITTNWQPFSFKENGDNPMGISYEYWQLVVDKLNLKTSNIFYTNFNKQLDSIKDKQSDIIFSAGETISRKEYAIFSNEYLKFPLSIVTKKDENFIENIEELIDKKIVVGNNFTAHNLLKNAYPTLELITVNSVKEGLELISKNEAFAFIDIKPLLSYNIAKYGFENLKISGNTGIDFELKFMIRDDYKLLVPILNKAISQIEEDKIVEIVNRWANVQFQTKFNYEIVWFLLIVIFLITLAFIYRNYVLKNLNNKLQVLVDEKTKSLHQINKNLEELVEEKSRDLIQKENILNHQSKMAAMGEMLENIAHQWRQPLSVVSTVATSLKLKQEMNILESKDILDSMDNINNSAQHLSDTIDDFRNFFSSEKIISPFYISKTIQKSIQLFKSNLDKYSIQVVEEIEDVELLSYENELIQVILKIVSNSLDALKQKDIEDRFILFSSRKKEDNLIITIVDSGGGVEDSMINRVFEPYFTTKHKSQGTGIGLYMSLNIITRHLKGTILISNIDTKFSNKILKGTKCEIIIPLNLTKI